MKLDILQRHIYFTICKEYDVCEVIIVENLRLLRKQAGLTMKQFGSELGMAESTVSLYEAGKRNPDIQTLIRFADYFDVSLDYLCGRNYDTVTGESTEVSQAVLRLLSQLNDEGQEKVLDYADDLVQSGKYIKLSTPLMGKEA